MPVPGTLPRDTLHFYRDLTPLSSFAEATEARTHKDVPEDWWIVIADVAGSTQAIEAGAYKKVNTVGVACIAAVANVDRSVDLPFIFGGDGATFAVPEALRERVECALRGAQPTAKSPPSRPKITNSVRKTVRGRVRGGGGGEPASSGSRRGTV